MQRERTGRGRKRENWQERKNGQERRTTFGPDRDLALVYDDVVW